MHVREDDSDDQAARAKLQRPALEFNLTQHCNLRCALCDHASPLLPEGFSTLEDFRQDMSILGEVLHARELKLVGGEPLLHPELNDFLTVARETGIADRLTVVTNGVLLHRVDPSLFTLLDKLWVSVYPGVRLRADLDELERLAVSHGFELKILRVDTFRETMLDQPHQDDELVRAVYRDCGMAHRWSCHTVLEGRYYKCSPAPFLEPRMVARGQELSNREQDGVLIRDNPDLHGDLERYLASPEPLAACRYCLGSNGREEPHRQLSQQDLARSSELDRLRPGPLSSALRLRRTARRLSAPIRGWFERRTR